MLKKNASIFMWSACFIALGCASTAPPYDQSRLQQSEAVVRIVVIEESGGSAYHFVRAKVLHVFKNSSSSSIGDEIAIGYLGAGTGLPLETECTAYLKHVKSKQSDLWILDETLSDAVTAKRGFSHSNISVTKLGNKEVRTDQSAMPKNE